jgi:hypothetical protein
MLSIQAVQGMPAAFSCDPREGPEKGGQVSELQPWVEPLMMAK